MKSLRTLAQKRLAWIIGLAACVLLITWKIAGAQEPRPSIQLAPPPVSRVDITSAPAVSAGPAADASATPAPAIAAASTAAVPPPDPSPVPAAPPAPEAAPAAPPTSVAAPNPVAPGASAATPSAPLTDPLPNPGKGVVFNFQNASLNDVLTYLSETAGFVILQEVPVTGTVNLVSQQAVSPDEAVDVLNTVLNDKGYTAIRSGRVLKIVSRKDVQKRDLPVEMGSDPAKIPHKDEVVTQILPLKFGDATKLVENLRPLLSDNATIAANEASNAILMTDTQTNIRRIAQIIRALDTSVASISSIRVFALQYADAKDVADLITQLFGNSQSSNNRNGQGQGGGRGFGGGRFGGFGFGPPGGGGPGGGGAEQSEARQAETRVTAVPDIQSNSVVVSAPEAVVAEIQDIISQIDTSITDITTTRIFRLYHADAVEMANIINSLYSDTPQQTTPQTGNRGGGNNNNQGRQFQPGGQQGGQARSATAAGGTERSLLQAKVNAVGDPRTNSLVVTASKDTMMKLVELVARLDATDSRKQHVYVHALQHADAENVAAVLRGMLGQQTVGPAAPGQTSTLMQRTTNGASLNAQDVLNTNSNAGGS